jgi:hypothetical protein
MKRVTIVGEAWQLQHEVAIGKIAKFDIEFAMRIYAGARRFIPLKSRDGAEVAFPGGS